jgi:hypothetical protein
MELVRSKIFRYLFECEKVSKGQSAFNQINNIMHDFKKSKQEATDYIIEFLVNYETIVEKYVPAKDQVYGELHYKTLSKMLQNYYKVAPYF